MQRGPQFLHYDSWWHLGFDTLLTSEWGTRDMIEKDANGNGNRSVLEK